MLAGAAEGTGQELSGWQPKPIWDQGMLLRGKLCGFLKILPTPGGGEEPLEHLREAGHPHTRSTLLREIGSGVESGEPCTWQGPEC